MSNFKKSFSFRNGVQVDTDNFVVTSTGLVGIGTTIPREYFHVFGDSKFENNVNIGTLDVVGVSTFSDTVNVGTAITIVPTTGIVSATAFYGNGATLSNLPTSQWQDVDVGLGFTSIYAVGNVGVGTDDPTGNYVFQVGSDPSTGDNLPGVGIGSDGNAYFSGIATYSGGINAGGISSVESFRVDSDGSTGTAAAFIIGDDKVRIRSDNGHMWSQGGIDIGDGYPGTYTGVSIAATGNAYFAGNVDIGKNLDVDGHAELDELNVSGVSTFQGNVDVTADIDVTGHTELDSLNVSGISTFDGQINHSTSFVSTGSLFLINPQYTSDLVIGGNYEVKLDHSGSSGGLSNLKGNLYITSEDGVVIRTADGSTKENAKFIANGAVELNYDNVKKFETTETGATFTENVDVVDNASILGSVAIGRTNALDSNLYIEDATSARVDLVTSTSEQPATISFGNVGGVLSDRAAFVYQSGTLNINNYQQGGILVNLHEGVGAGTTENFAIRHLGQELLTVSPERRVGINKALPEVTLDVDGDVRVTGTGQFVGIVTIGQGENQFTLGDGSPLPIPQTQNFNTQVGLSTFFSLNLLGGITIESNAVLRGGGIEIFDTDSLVQPGFLGIRTDTLDDHALAVDGSAHVKQGFSTQDYIYLTKNDNGAPLVDPRPVAVAPFDAYVPYFDYGEFQVNTGGSAFVSTQLVIVPYEAVKGPGYGQTDQGLYRDDNGTGYLSVVGINTYIPRSTLDVGTATTSMNNYFIPPSCTQDQIDIMVDLWDDSTHPNNPNFVWARKVTPNGIVPGGILYNETTQNIEVGIKPREFAPLGVPIGGIIMWYGAVNTIPNGYALCDGTNGTPDLRDKFVIGAGNDYSVNDTVGVTTSAGTDAFALAYIMRTNA